MIWTNIFKLPEPFAHLVSEDLYHEERERQLLEYCARHQLNRADVVHFSASDLIRPPRMRVLVRRHFKEIVSDVSMHVYRVLGTAIHTVLRLSAKRLNERAAVGVPEPYIAEDRRFTHFKLLGAMVVISGEPDLITPDGVLHDYKVTAVHALESGVKLEWEQATNIYCWLRALEGKATKGISIAFILRDWKSSMVVQEGYPPAGAQTMDVPLWDIGTMAAYVMERARLHLEADGLVDDKLPECSAYEMWEKPESWAVIREEGKRAAKVYRFDAFPAGTGKDVLELAAASDRDLRNAKKAKAGEKPYVVEHRPGERTRCSRFCDARSFCSQYKEYAAASYGKMPAAEPRPEAE